MIGTGRLFLLVVMHHFCSSTGDAQQMAFDEAHGSPDCLCVNPWAGLPADNCSNVTKEGHTTCLP